MYPMNRQNLIYLWASLVESEDAPQGEPSRYWKKRNMNPWGRNIDDCAIRAVSAALWMKYQAVCEIFGKRCVPGVGLEGSEGIGLGLIKLKLGRFFDRVEDSFDLLWKNRPEEFEDMEFDPAFDADPDLGLTLQEFCAAYENQGRFLISLVPTQEVGEITPERRKNGHIVYADLSPGRNWFMDTFDSSGMTVKAYMRVKNIWNMNDPRSLAYGIKTRRPARS